MPIEFSHLTTAQVQVLSSALRCDILMGFKTLGPCGIKDVANWLGRRPDSLYHHVRKLTEVELLHQVGSRRVVKRDEAMFEVVSTNTLLKPRPWDDEYLRAARRFISSTIEAVRVESDMVAKLLGSSSNPNDRLFARRYALRLSKADTDEFFKKLNELGDWLIEREFEPEGERYTCMVVGIPAYQGKKGRAKE